MQVAAWLVFGAIGLAITHRWSYASVFALTGALVMAPLIVLYWFRREDRQARDALKIKGFYNRNNPEWRVTIYAVVFGVVDAGAFCLLMNR